jgi:L-lactate dehydrogenase complex protein LldG
MNSRDFILASVRRNEPPDTELPAIPEFGPPVPDLLAAFTEALALMGGTVTQQPTDTVEAFIAQLFPQARVVCSAAPEVRGTRVLVRDGDPRELQDVDVAVVRAAFGVAETGSVWLSEREFGIVRNLHDAYRHPRFRTARYAVLMTGPSATADIEGVLVRGAQGIRSLTVIPIA